MDKMRFGQIGASDCDHPFEALLRALIQHGSRVSRLKADTARLTCPVHRDARPSLVLTRKADRVLLFCFAGCEALAIVKRVGFRWADLFVHGRPPEPSRPVATYDYYQANGELLAQKVRLHPKAFRWRRPDPSHPNRWLPGLDGAEPGLYRLPDLIDVSQVFCLEGEKAVDLFWALKLPACCPPGGASQWTADWSVDLQRAGCKELVVLADADRAGAEHAERVAAVCFDLPQHRSLQPLSVKVVSLSGLAAGADAFDWLHQGHTASELLEIVSDASYWEPGAKERERAERKRRLTRERVRRFRERSKASVALHHIRLVGTR